MCSINKHLTVTDMEYSGVKYLMWSMEKNWGICLFRPAAKRYLQKLDFKMTFQYFVCLYIIHMQKPEETTIRALDWLQAIDGHWILFLKILSASEAISS